MKNPKQVIIAIATFFGGIYFFLEFILPQYIGTFKFSFYHDQISTGFQTVGTMAIGLGLINILRVHSANIIKTRKGWPNSVALIIGLFVTMGIYGADLINGEQSVEAFTQVDNLAHYTSTVTENYETVLHRSGKVSRFSLKILAYATREIEEDFNKQNISGVKRAQLLVQSLDALTAITKARKEYFPDNKQADQDEELVATVIKDLAASRDKALALQASYSKKQDAASINLKTNSLLAVLNEAQANVHQVLISDYSRSGVHAATRIEHLIQSVEVIRSQVQSNEGYLRSVETAPGENMKQRAPPTNPLVNDLTSVGDKATAFKDAFTHNATEQGLEINNKANELLAALRTTLVDARQIASTNYENSYAQQASDLVFKAFFAPLGSAMFALLAFYIATAAYRSFRVKSLEAFIMMITAIVVILGQIPHGPALVSDSLPGIRHWILRTLNAPAFRAIYFCSAIAGLAMAVRMWLSLEKSPLQTDDSSEERSRSKRT